MDHAPKLDTQKTIKALPERREPYWNILEYCRHIGLEKKPAKPLHWVARIRKKDGRYKQRRLGPAVSENSQGLSYEAAIALARAWFSEQELRGKLGRSELERQMMLLEQLNPDAFSRLISRSAGEHEDVGVLRRQALSQARLLTDGVKGGVFGLASQVSIAETLQQDGVNGIEYLQAASEADKAPLLCLTANVPVA